MKRLKNVTAADDSNPKLEEAVKSLEDDFDFVMSGLDMLGRKGPNAENKALVIAENLSKQIDAAITELAESIETE